MYTFMWFLLMVRVTIVPFFSLQKQKLGCWEFSLIQTMTPFPAVTSPHLHHGHQLLELPEFLLRCLLMSLLDETAVVPQAASSAGLGNFTVGSAGPHSFVIIRTVFILIVILRPIEGGVPIVLTI